MIIEIIRQSTYDKILALVDSTLGEQPNRKVKTRSRAGDVTILAGGRESLGSALPRLNPAFLGVAKVAREKISPVRCGRLSRDRV